METLEIQLFDNPNLNFNGLGEVLTKIVAQVSATYPRAFLL